MTKRLLSLALGACAPATISAATFTVTNLADGAATVGSLRWATEQANLTPNNAGNPVDVVEFDPVFFNVARTITLGQELHLSGPTEVRGPGAGLLTISGSDSVRALSVGAGGNVDLEEVTITNGRSSAGPASAGTGPEGGGIRNAGTLRLRGVVVTGNIADQGNFSQYPSGYGGGIFNAGTLTITDSTISGNKALPREATAPPQQAEAQGGGIYNALGGDLTVVNCVISDNLG